MYYRTREWVDERLRLKPRQSYRIVPATPSGRIQDVNVLALLNRSRVGIRDALTLIPCDLMTPDETVAHFAESAITLADLRRWTHRTRNVPPHFRINRNTIRYSAEMLDNWLKENSAPQRRRCA